MVAKLVRFVTVPPFLSTSSKIPINIFQLLILFIQEALMAGLQHGFLQLEGPNPTCPRTIASIINLNQVKGSNGVLITYQLSLEQHVNSPTECRLHASSVQCTLVVLKHDATSFMVVWDLTTCSKHTSVSSPVTTSVSSTTSIPTTVSSTILLTSTSLVGSGTTTATSTSQSTTKASGASPVTTAASSTSPVTTKATSTSTVTAAATSTSPVATKATSTSTVTAAATSTTPQKDGLENASEDVKQVKEMLKLFRFI